jgi:hypothetical protein
MKQAFRRISRDSPKNAEKVIDEIHAAVGKAASNPRHYNPDKYKKDNDGSYRPLKNIATAFPTGLPKTPFGCSGFAIPAWNQNCIETKKQAC